MINICNLKTYNKKLEWKNQVYAGRPGVLGNPWPLDTEKDRIPAILRYEDYFLKQMESGAGPLWDEVQRLIGIYKEYGELDLLCWCSPRDCHTSVIKDYILSCVG